MVRQDQAKRVYPGPSPTSGAVVGVDKLGKQKRAKIKKLVYATHTQEKECHKILHGEDSYFTQVKALNYLDHT